MKTAVYITPIGNLAITDSDGFITSVSIVPDNCPGERTALTDKAAKQIDEYLSGKRRVFEVPVRFAGSDFEKRVWSELMRIPYGETRTYGQIAAYIGLPKAARAVGNACHANPVLLIIPCHRVTAASRIGGFGFGVEMKTRLLELERKGL